MASNLSHSAQDHRQLSLNRILLAAVLLLGASVSGCTALTLEDRYAPVRNVEVDDALVSEEALYVTFLHEGTRHFYRGDLGRSKSENGNATFGRIVVMQSMKETEWNKKTEGLRSCVRHSSEEWSAFCRAMIQDLLPLEANTGLAVRVDQRKFYLVNGEQGSTGLRWKEERPASAVSPVELEISRFKDRAIEHLRMTGDEGEKANLFKTGYTGPSSLLYSFLDPVQEDGVYLMFEPVDRSGGLGGWLRHNLLERPSTAAGLMSVAVRSHTVSLLNHPVTAPLNLLTFLTDATGNVMSRVLMNVHGFPKLERQEIPELTPDRTGMDLDEFEAWLDRNVRHRRATADVELLIDGDAYHARLKEAILNARKSIHIRTYIFDNDDVALEIADLLKKRSREIEVRIIVDGIGTCVAADSQADSLPEGYRTATGCIIDYLREDSEVAVRRRPNTWFRGDHTKCIIIDESTAFLGGMNVGREYRYDWHDMMVEVEGPVVAQMEHGFRDAWRDSGLGGGFARILGQERRPCVDSDGPGVVRLLETRPGAAEIYRVQLEAIRRARNSICIENAYFSDDRILYELCRARKRGVDVRVILPARNDSGMLHRSNLVAANTMLRHGVRVYLTPRMSHVKAAVYDGWACFGSANFDLRSLQKNRELNLATSDPKVVAGLMEHLFGKDMENADELTRPVALSWVDHLAEVVADVVG